jgi:hypothetical protein
MVLPFLTLKVKYMMRVRGTSLESAMVKMKFSALFFLILLVMGLSPSIVTQVGGASDPFVGGRQEFYIVKEVIEVTSDWQDIKWIQGPKVYAVRHRVLEGADAVKNLEVTGLTAWITQKSLDTVKVVLEIEALTLKGDETAQVVIEKGAIGSAKVELTVYEPSTGGFSEVTEFSTDRMSRDFEFDIASIYAEPVGELVLEETLNGLKGKVLSFYYPWYTSPHGPSGRWDHWLDVTEDSIFDSAHYPLHGAYDSNDENVIRSHMAIAKQAGMDAFIVSWWGIGSYEEKPVDEILTLAEQMDLNITFYYESVRDLTRDEIVGELTYLFESYSDHPAFLRVSEKPVVFVYAVPAYSRGPDFWLYVRGQVEENVGPVVLIGDTDNGDYLHVFDGFHVYIHLGEDVPGFYRGCVDRFEVGISTMDTDELFTAAYSGEDLDMRVKPFLLTVTPGFDATSWGRLEPYVDRLGGETYAGYWDVVEEIGPHSVLITSWNEWHEGTEMEPSREHGFDYIGMTRGFIEEYKGASLPEPEAAYSATAEPFRQDADLTGAGEILISAEGAPALYVNVSVRGGAGVTSLDLDGDFYTYVKRQRGDHASMIIPSVAPGEPQEIEAVFEAESPNPVFTVSVTAMDPTGTAHELFNGDVGSIAEGSITASASSGSIEYGEAITISGHLSPEIGGNEVDLEYTGPDSTTSTRTATTSDDGSYSDLFEPPSVGAWKVEASWGGDEDFEGATSQVVGFIVRKAPTSLSLQPSAPGVRAGETLTLSGSIEPAVQGAEVSIVYTMPDGTTERRTEVTDSDGGFSDSITPTDTGSWTVRANWEGDSTHLEAVSGEVTLQVEEKRTPGIIPGFPYESMLLGLVLAALMLLAFDRRVHGH